MKRLWQLSEAKSIYTGMSRDVSEEVLESVRPGDFLCVVFNGQATMWCKVVSRLMDDPVFICIASYPIPRFDIQPKQKIFVKGSQVINVLAGLNHKKPWEEIHAS